MLAGVLLASSVDFLGASVTFGSRDSAINVAAGARFNVGSSNLIVNGTLEGDQGAVFTGQPVAFDNGLFSSGGLEAVMDGEFDPSGANYIRLQGNGSFRAEPGTLLQGLTVAGSPNTVEGQPLFQSPITLADSNTELTLALQSALNQNIVLNGGQVSLNDNLSLNDDVQIIGPGAVSVNQRQLSLGSEYTSPWATSIEFDNAADIVLNGQVSLTGTWTFDGVNCLTGNGTLDLSGGGQLIVDNGATLLIDGIHITGLGNSAGQLIMRNAASTIYSSGSTFEFTAPLTINNGTFYANGGSTTFLTGANNVTFAGPSKLTVDGTTLWLDCLDKPATPGMIIGTMDLLNHGTVKSLVDRSLVGSGRDALTEILINTIITGPVTIDQNVYLGPGEGIVSSGSGGVIDGAGMQLQFSEQSTPQFTIRPGSTVTIQNIELVNINQNTFDLRDDSTLVIGDNVSWYLDEDITFSHGTVVVANGASGSNVWTLRGQTTRKNFTFAPLNPTLPSGATRKMLQFGHNTVQLESVELGGFTYMAFASSGGIDPFVAMTRNASVDINIDTAMNFLAEGIDNDLILRNDGQTLSGGILFGDLPDNRLSVRFSLAAPLDDTQPYRAGVQEGYPVLQIAGGPGIFLTSALGLAELDFIDTRAALRLENSNAFIAEVNSLLTFNYLQVLENPISQMSRLFRTDGTSLIGSIDASGARQVTRAHAPQYKIPVSALQIRRQKAREEFAHAQAAAIAAAHQSKPAPKPSHKPLVKPLPKQLFKKRGLDVNMVESEAEPEIMRSLNLPTTFAAQPVGQLLPQTRALNGNIHYVDCQLTNVTVDATSPFNILLDQGSSLTQGSSPIVLQSTHIINVTGIGNKIYVTGTFQFGQGNLNLDTGAELTFVFVNNGSSTPQVVINDDTTLDDEVSASLKFTGNGSVVLGDGTILNLKGTKPSVGVVTARSQLTVGSDTVMTVRQGGTARISGIGAVEVTDGGAISIGSTSHLIWGLTSAPDTTVGADLVSDITLLVHNDAEFSVAGTTANPGLISFCYGKSAITFEDRGKLLIYDGGTLELDANNGVATPGNLSLLSFGSDGLLSINGNGLLLMGPNYFNPLIAQQNVFAYNGLVASIMGNGLVGFVTNDPRTPYSSYTGRLNPTAAAYQQSSSMTAESFVTMMVQQLPTLTVSTLYINAQGQNVVRTKAGVSVTLQTGETVVSDDAATGVITCQNAQGNFFTIAANGTRS
jgi:hypothetical protein